MEYLLALILLSLVLAALAWPILRGQPRQELTTGASLDDLLAQRDGYYASLRDLDLDYQLGKIDSDDYKSRREKYLTRAADALRQLDLQSASFASHSRFGDEIETQVAAIRGTIQGDQGFMANVSRTSTNGHSSSLYCTRCGEACQPDDRFCRKCGQELPK